MIEFGAGGAITHAEEPTTTVPETAEAPTVDGSASPAVASGSAGEEASGPAAATGDGEADAPVVADASQASAEPVGDSTPAEASSPPQDSTTPAAQATPNVLPIAPVPPNPRRKRRAKGWFCPVCRQRKSSPRRSILLFFPKLPVPIPSSQFIFIFI